MKVGIIRCMQTEDFCPGTTDFRMIREKKGAFEGVEEDIEIIGFINCGGCPGKKAVLRAYMEGCFLQEVGNGNRKGDGTG